MRRPESGLSAEAFQGLRISRQFIGQKFEGDEAAKFGILSLIHHPHAPASKLFDHSVVRDGLADHERWQFAG